MERTPLLVTVLAAGRPSDSGAAPKRWGPTSGEVTGALATQTRMRMTMAVVKRVGGAFEGDQIVKVERGRHAIVLRSPTRHAVPGTEPMVELDVEPCTRCDFNAQFRSATGDEWMPVVTRVESLAGCKLPAAT